VVFVECLHRLVDCLFKGGETKFSFTRLHAFFEFLSKIHRDPRVNFDSLQLFAEHFEHGPVNMSGAATAYIFEDLLELGR
jgi:hypothetical protein